MDTREKTYFKEAIKFLKENGIELNEYSIKRTINHIKDKNREEKYKKRRAKYMDSNFMKFVNDYESEVYCGANIQ